MDVHPGYICRNTGPKTTCQVIHPGTSCFTELANKAVEVVGKSCKLYALLYLAMFVVKFKKIRSERKLKKTIIAWTKDYLWSLVFMSWLVGGMKLALCTLNYFGSPLDGTHARNFRPDNTPAVADGLPLHLLHLKIEAPIGGILHFCASVPVCLHIPEEALQF